MKYSGINAKKRKILSAILSTGKSIITIDSAAKELQIERSQAQSILWSFHRGGWLKLITNGIYSPVPIESSDEGLSSENSYVLASYIFDPCYMGGWSSASHWGLTDQIFHTSWVFTSKPVRKKEVEKGSHDYLLTHITEKDFIGTQTVWYGVEKVLFADPHRTVIDFLNNPNLFGPQNMVDVLDAYIHAPFKNMTHLLEYAHTISNKTTFKRLGFLLEYLDYQDINLIKSCQSQISQGPSPLSSKANCDLYIKKWHLKVPSYMVKK